MTSSSIEEQTNLVFHNETHFTELLVDKFGSFLKGTEPQSFDNEVTIETLESGVLSAAESSSIQVETDDFDWAESITSINLNGTMSQAQHHVVKKADAVMDEESIVGDDVIIEEVGFDTGSIVDAEEAMGDSAMEDSYDEETAISERGTISSLLSLLTWDSAEELGNEDETGEVVVNEGGGFADDSVGADLIEDLQSMDNASNGNVMEMGKDDDVIAELDSIVDAVIANSNPLSAELDAIEEKSDGILDNSPETNDIKVMEKSADTDSFSSSVPALDEKIAVVSDVTPVQTQQPTKKNDKVSTDYGTAVEETTMLGSVDIAVAGNMDEKLPPFVDPANWPLLPPVKDNDPLERSAVLEVIVLVPYDDNDIQSISKVWMIVGVTW